MRDGLRAAVFGGDELRASAAALGLDVVDADPQLVLCDLRDPTALAAAALVPAAVPRVVIAGDGERVLAGALGVDPSRVAPSCEPHVIGPLVAAARPARARAATRVVVVTAVRGGTGRTLLVANLARRLPPRLSLCALDLTGTGALAWWLGCEARPWSELEALREELSADHLAVLASDVAPGLRVLGGPPRAPTPALAAVTIRVALGLADVVLADTPLVSDPLFDAVAGGADRVLVLAYDDAVSRATLAAAVPEGAWLVASQSSRDLVGDREAFRALPRDENAIGAAAQRRDRVGGSLGRAYDELADLIALDAS